MGKHRERYSDKHRAKDQYEQWCHSPDSPRRRPWRILGRKVTRHFRRRCHGGDGNAKNPCLVQASPATTSASPPQPASPAVEAAVAPPPFQSAVGAPLMPADAEEQTALASELPCVLQRPAPSEPSRSRTLLCPGRARKLRSVKLSVDTSISALDASTQGLIAYQSFLDASRSYLDCEGHACASPGLRPKAGSW